MHILPCSTRVEGWFLLDNYVPTLVCSILYLLIVWLGPKYMKTNFEFIFVYGVTVCSNFTDLCEAVQLSQHPLLKDCLPALYILASSVEDSLTIGVMLFVF